MTAESLGLLALYLAVALLCVKPLGLYVAQVMEGRTRFSSSTPAALFATIATSTSTGAVDPLGHLEVRGAGFAWAYSPAPMK